MKKRELAVFRKKEIKDLEKILGEKRKEAREVFSKVRGGQEKNTKQFRNLRREIAQILTIIRQKEIIGSSVHKLENSKKRESLGD